MGTCGGQPQVAFFELDVVVKEIVKGDRLGSGGVVRHKVDYLVISVPGGAITGAPGPWGVPVGRSTVLLCANFGGSTPFRVILPVPFLARTRSRGKVGADIGHGGVQTTAGGSKTRNEMGF
jgi:hypothetical protein